MALCAVALGSSSLGISACGGSRPAKTAAHVEKDPEGAIQRDAFVCANGQTLATQYDSEEKSLALAIDESLVRLRQVFSASGEKFTNGEVTFWHKGDQATLEVAGVTTECQRQLRG